MCTGRQTSKHFMYHAILTVNSKKKNLARAYLLIVPGYNIVEEKNELALALKYGQRYT